MPKLVRIVGCLALLLSGLAHAQTVLLDEVHSLGADGAGVPVEFPVSIVAAGNYEVVLTDLGLPNAPLESVRVAVVKGTAVVGTPLTAAGTLPFAATANSNYVIHVTGKPGNVLGSGAFRVDLRNPASSTVLESFVSVLAPPAATPVAGKYVLDTAVTVPASGDYDVSFNDLLLPARVSTLLIALVEQGGSLVTTLDNSAGDALTKTVTLDAAKQYRIFSIAVTSSPDAGGLYSLDVSATGGGANVVRRVAPVGGVVLLGSVDLAADNYTLSIKDLMFPSALSAMVAQVVRAGQPVAAAATSTAVPFAALAGTHDVYGYGAVGAGASAGSIDVGVAPAGAAAVFTAAHVFAVAGATKAFTYDVTIPTGGVYRVRLADYQFPTAFQSLKLAAVQNGAILLTPITGAGSIDVTATAGKLSLLSVAQPATAGSLYGADVSPTALGAAAFETTEGVGGQFIRRKLTVAATASFDVRVADLAFPAAFGSLSTAVTRGSDRIGLVFGAGTFPFDATPGNYFLNLIAQPAANQSAGTYAVSAIERPPAPVVTLTATPTSVSATGGAVDLTWSTETANSCTASGGWTGTKAVSGTERTATITKATTFTLTCTGDGGTTVKDIMIDLAAAVPDNGGSGGGGAFDLATLAALALALVAMLVARLRKSLAGLLIAALVVLAGCGGMQSRYERAMDRGLDYLKSGQLEKARVEFRNAMQINPQAPEAHYEAGVVAQRRSDYREALTSYQAAIDLKPDYPEARAALARIFLLAGVTDRAMETIRPGFEKNPENVDLLVARGLAYAQLKKMPEARADAEHALKVKPDDENAVALMSSLFRAANEPEQAITLLEKSLHALPDSIDLRRVLATLKIESGDLAGAETQFKETVRIHPDEPALRYELANFYVRAKNLDAAQKTLEAAVTAIPGNSETKLILANFLAMQRSRAEGEAALRALIAKEPDNLDLRLGLAALFERTGADAEAVATYEEIIKLDPDSPKSLTARNRLAAYYSTHGDLPKAQVLLGEVIKANPHDIDALTQRAKIEIDSGGAAAAVVDLRSVLRDVPDSPQAYRMLARAHLELGQAPLGEDALRKALDLAPTDTSTRVELAQLLIRTNRAGASIEMLEDAVRRSPNDAGVREALTRAYVEVQDYKAAARSAEDIQLLAPGSPLGFVLRGQIAQLQKNPAEAEKQYERALEIAPRSVEALAVLARLKLAGGHADEAIARVEQSLAQDGGNAALQNLDGEILLAAGQAQRAVAPLTQAIKLAPKAWLPYRNLAIAKYSLKDAGGAIGTYREGIRLIPDSTSLVVDLASLYELEKRIDDAAALYEGFHARHPGDNLVTNNLAKLLLTHKNDSKSLTRAAELAESFADAPDPALLDTFGWSLYRRGDFARAQRTLETAFARAPESGSIRYHLALVQVQSGQVSKAIDNLEIAVLSPRAFVGLAEARSLLTDLKSRAS